MSGHVLRITRAADDQNDDAEYEIICPNKHPNDICTGWNECTKCTDRDDFHDLIEDLLEQDEIVLHGVAHKWIEGYVCTEGDKCIVRASDVEYDIDPNRLPVGDHPIEYECEDGGVFVTFPALEGIKFPTPKE